ncbi:MAG TPA: ATP-binding cassette domain-containing protein, partial [Verrucomicrobiae bacterium]|nr:ATP-binding cassette domain-containing protein [Verrucomicrobiae bacterium]
REAIDRAIASAGIGELLGRKVFTLSDGESQKVMLARALAQDTPILMLDEPTAHLDLPSRIRLMRLLHRLARELGKGILLSTHELDLALQVADEVWLLEAGAETERSGAPAAGSGAAGTMAGSFHKGTPEDLILQGIFEAVFAREEVVFDRAAGVFRIPPAGVREVRLEGEGVEAFWTRRALQRVGFAIAEDGTATANPVPGTTAAVALVRIRVEAGRPVWILETGNRTIRLDTIAGLLKGLGGQTHAP